jgi:hypothetical protein
VTRSRWFPALALVALAIPLLILAAVFADDKHGVKWVLGGIGWFGFWLCVLALIVWGVWTFFRTMRMRGGAV